MSLSLIFLVGVIAVIATCSATESEYVVLRAVRGCDARLPCGQGKVFLDGPDSYVLWMKDNSRFLHRYPNEVNNRASLIQTMRGFGPEYDGETYVDPTSLQLKQVGLKDGGVYRCRVHYQATSAVDFVIELRIVDSPGTPKVINPDGFDLSGNIGLLSLGSNMTLICEISDAADKPGTLLWWERNGEEIARVETVQDGALRATMRVLNVTRAELGAHYVCLAQNADVTDPLTASVVVNMHLPPISVEIRLNNNVDFEAGHPRVVDCVVVGCVPPPTITWHLGDVMLRPSVHKEIHHGNITVSSLTLAPSLRDDKHELTCRVHNSHFPKEIYEDKVVLNVGYRPTCVKDKEKVIGYVAGQTECVTCVVDAYPEPLQFSWTFADTKTLYTSVTSVPGHPHRYSSSLTWVPQEHQQGELLCRAINELGEQKQACVFPIVAGGSPCTPDCETEYDIDQDTIKIVCKKTWDGGRPQTIHLELQHDGNTLQNVSDSRGSFALPQLQINNMTAVVYASNSRGRSLPLVLPLTQNFNYTAEKAPDDDDVPVGAIVIEVVAGTIAGCALLYVLRYCLTKRNTNAETAVEEETYNMTSNGSYHRQPEFQPASQECRYNTHVIMRIPTTTVTCYNSPTKAARLLGFSTPATMSPENMSPANMSPATKSPARTLDMVSESETERETYFV